MDSRRCITVCAVTAALGFAAACGEPTATITPTPTIQTPKFLWSTVIALGGAIAADSAAVYLGGIGSEIIVLSKQTGLTTRTLPQSASTNDDGLRMVGSALLSSGSSLRLVDLTSGATRWQYNAARFDTPLLVNDSIAYIAGAASPNVHAVRLSNGTAKWVGEAVSPSTPAPTNSTVTITGGALDGTLYVATFAVTISATTVLQAGMVAFDARTGERKWTIALADPGMRLGRPAISNGVAVATTGGGVSYGVDVNSGQRVWSTAAAGIPSSVQMFIGGHAYAVNGFAVTTDASLGRSALDLASGQRLWRAPDLGFNTLNAVWAMVLPNGQFVATNVGGELIGLDVSRTPRVVWSYPLALGDPPVAAATLGDTLFFTTRQRVHAIIVPR